MGNNFVPKFIFRLSRFPIYRGSVLGRFYCTIMWLYNAVTSFVSDIFVSAGRRSVMFALLCGFWCNGVAGRQQNAELFGY